MIDAIKKTIAAAEELGKVTDMDVLDFGENRKMVFLKGVTENGLPFEVELKIGIKAEEEADEK